MLKVISGQYARRALATPPPGITRPVSEKARGAIFNILAEIVPGARVLDLFAGSGALGIEALSRGAASVDFVEKNKKALTVIEKNLDEVGVEVHQARVFARSVTQFFRDNGGEYDIILMDPPYAEFSTAIVEQAGSLLQYTGAIVVSTASTVQIDPIAGLDQVQQKVYGDSMITVLQKR